MGHYARPADAGGLRLAGRERRWAIQSAAAPAALSSSRTHPDGTQPPLYVPRKDAMGKAGKGTGSFGASSQLRNRLSGTACDSESAFRSRPPPWSVRLPVDSDSAAASSHGAVATPISKMLMIWILHGTATPGLSTQHGFLAQFLPAFRVFKPQGLLVYGLLQYLVKHSVKGRQVARILH